MMLKADGSFIVNHYRSFDPSTYEVAYRFGRPYYLRELSPESDFGEKINSQITFTPNVPFGLIVKADPEAGLSFSDLPMDKIRTLSSRHSVLLLQGFSAVNETDFVIQSEKMGEVVCVFIYSNGLISMLTRLLDLAIHRDLSQNWKKMCTLRRKRYSPPCLGAMFRSLDKKMVCDPIISSLPAISDLSYSSFYNLIYCRLATPIYFAVPNAEHVHRGYAIRETGS